ncbi:uncharacterized protein BDV17DRAFT_203671 [Aspergillus undulatus]|uniref:uncharacterized protein n=1 Tax=Aspergillus undulatus TaxID=1810928 RepID=UPI003CCDEBF2
MHSFLALVPALSLSAIAAASPMPQGERPTLPVTIYDEPNFEGESVRFPPDGTCKTISPWIGSVEIPEEQDIYCQLFDNVDCTGQGANVTISSIPRFRTEEIFPGIVCGILL